jgi:WD40 repeat protein
LVTLIDHGSPFKAIAFSPDGHLLAACSQDGTVRLWDGTPAMNP